MQGTGLTMPCDPPSPAYLSHCMVDPSIVRFPPFVVSPAGHRRRRRYFRRRCLPPPLPASQTSPLPNTPAVAPAPGKSCSPTPPSRPPPAARVSTSATAAITTTVGLSAGRSYPSGRLRPNSTTPARRSTTPAGQPGSFDASRAPRKPAATVLMTGGERPTGGVCGCRRTFPTVSTCSALCGMEGMWETTIVNLATTMTVREYGCAVGCARRRATRQRGRRGRASSATAAAHR